VTKLSNIDLALFVVTWVFVVSGFGALWANLTKVHSDIGTIKGEVYVLKNDVSTLKNDVSTLKTSVSSLCTKMNSLLRLNNINPDDITEENNE